MNKLVSKNPLFTIRFIDIAILWVSSVIAAVVASGMDAFDACFALCSTTYITSTLFSMLPHIIGPHLLASVALATIGWLMVWSGTIVQQRFFPKYPWSTSGFIALIALPGLIYISIYLFQGGFTSRLPARHWLIGLTVVFIFMVVFFSLQFFFKAWRYIASKKTVPNWKAICAAGICFLLSVAFRWCDAHLYKRLYPLIHVVVTLVTLCLILLGIFLLLHTLLNAAKKRIIVICVLPTFVVSSFFIFKAPAPSQTIANILFEQTVTLANLLNAMPRNRSESDPSVTSRTQLGVDEILQSLPKNSSLSHLPTYPGAHLIVISIDALRAESLGTYGYRERNISPTIDSIAKQSTVFEHAYCAAPHSAFSITSFHVSRNTYVEKNIHQTPSYPTIADTLKKYGYETEAFYTDGIFYTEGEKLSHYKVNKFGFSSVTHPGSNPLELTQQVTAAIDDNVRSGEPPLFLWTHYFNVHEPYRSTHFGNSPKDRYEGEIYEVDKAIESLVGYVQQTLSRDTIIILTADHGEEFMDHGGYYHGSSLYDEQVRVPFIIRLPQKHRGRIQQAISLLDMAPTALGLLGIPKPISMQGRDLRPLIFEGETALLPRPVFSAVMNQFMTVQWPWKLIANPSRNLFRLYQLEMDVKEQVNLYDSEPERANILQKQLHAWLDRVAATKDPAQMAINLGKMGDKRAIEPLLALAEDATAHIAHRQKALALLADIQAVNSASRLVALLDTNTKDIPIYAALALSAINHDGAKPLLIQCLSKKEGDIKYRCALALAKLRDATAVPHLIETAIHAPASMQKPAIRYLGIFEDPSAVEPLVNLLPRRRTLSMTALALGKIGDRRAVAPLRAVLKKEKFTNIRESLVIALGLLGQSETAVDLLHVLKTEPEIPWTLEALLRVHALKNHYVFGVDIGANQSNKMAQFTKCQPSAPPVLRRFLDSNYCRTKRNQAVLKFTTQSVDANSIYLRIRTSQTKHSAKVHATIRIDNHPIATVPIDNKWKEHIFAPSNFHLSSGVHNVSIQLDSETSFDWDHFVIVPKATGPTN